VQTLLDRLFSLEGLLSRSLKEFEERPGQKEMASQVFSAYENEEIALIEAGTGTGKSFAYLLPAVHYAIEHQEKTVISTHTIALQEQLVERDLPFLLRTMGVDLKCSLVKGMGNYLCLRKLEEIKEVGPEEEKLKIWADKTRIGSKSDLSFPVTNFLWEKVQAEKDLCSHTKCPHYKSCFFFKARRQVFDAQILIVNHHLLLAHMSSSQDEKSILPPFERLIVDEAHHIEDVTRDMLSMQFDRLSLIRLLGRIYSDIYPEKSRLAQIAHLGKDLDYRLIQRLETDLPAEKENLVKCADSAFLSLEKARPPLGEIRRRLTQQTFDTPLFQTTLKSDFTLLSDGLKKFSHSLISLKKDLEDQEELLGIHLLDLQAVSLRLDAYATGIEQFFKTDVEAKWVRSLEVRREQIFLGNALLDVSSYLKEELFEKFSTVVLCSATLATSNSFKFIRTRLGIPEEALVTENIYASPFSYQTQALFALPDDIPDPSDPHFVSSVIDAIVHIIEASSGNAFILFTSYDLLNRCYESVARSSHFHFLKQGDLPRTQLLERFKSKEGSVLFGTDSFWEGVDVAGEALRCVVLVKLPFRVPNDPFMEAQADLLLRQGKDPFIDYAIPQAVVKFKQGFGRLIRKKSDRGCIVCLDRRLITRRYGKYFFDSLPPARRVIGPSALIYEEMRNFYCE